MFGLPDSGIGKVDAIVGWTVTGKRHVMDTIGYRINGNVKVITGGCTKVTGSNTDSGV